MKKFAYDYVENYLKSKNYTLLSDTYTGIKDKITFIDDLNYKYFTSFENILADKIPEKFHSFNPYTIDNIKNWLLLNKVEIELISTVYENNSNNLEWLCLHEDCKELILLDWLHMQQYKKCPYCVGQRVGISNCLFTKNPELCEEWDYDKNIDITPYKITSGSGKKVWWKCKLCSHSWIATVDSRHTSSCPACSFSKGEREIKTWLDYNNIKYESQKMFSQLVGTGGRQLSYDFYLPNENLLIEYQGQFHDGNGNYYIKQNLEKQTEHDKRKRNYAINNKIDILEIWYWDFENISDILNAKIKNMF